MATLQELRKKINSGEQLQSVVKTMKTIAAVNIRQFERAVKSLENYTETIERGLQIAVQNRPEGVGFARAESISRPGAIVFGSDQGMCGQFNEKIVSHALNFMHSYWRGERTWSVLPVGLRVAASLERSDFPLDDPIRVSGSLDGVTPVVRDILMHIDRWRTEGEIDTVYVFHNRPLSGSSYRSGHQRLLPMDRSWLEGLAQKDWPTNVLPMFTMEWDTLFSSLVGQYLFVAIFRACAESMAAENASRVASMQAAERNIDDRLEDLNAKYRHERQRSITEELFDIVSGFEALSGE
jgi:F-type H+-transporting ATPase subunit gamma